MRLRDHLDHLYVLLAVLAPTSVAGQQWSPPLAPTPEECARAQSYVRDTGPSPERKPAMQYLARCGAQGGVALAEELRALRGVSNSGTLVREYADLARILDGAVLRAALDLAADRAATPESRIIAFKLLISYADWRQVSLPFSSFLPGNARVLASQDHFGRSDGAPLPADWLTSAVAVVEAVAASSEETDTMRYAAERTLTHLR
jgi:hypothetical protein